MPYQTLLMIQQMDTSLPKKLRGRTAVYDEFSEEAFMSIENLIDVLVEANLYYKLEAITANESSQMRAILKQVAERHFEAAAQIVEDTSSPRFDTNPSYSTVNVSKTLIQTSSGTYEATFLTYLM